MRRRFDTGQATRQRRNRGVTHRLLPLDLAVVRRWGERAAAARANGTPVGAVDALIATTAVHHGLAVATRNGRDFEHLAVEVVDPWTRAGLAAR